MNSDTEEFDKPEVLAALTIVEEWVNAHTPESKKSTSDVFSLNGTLPTASYCIRFLKNFIDHVCVESDSEGEDGSPPSSVPPSRRKRPR